MLKISKKQTILVIDNYDSFTFNLVQLLGMSSHKIIVRENDKITAAGIKKISPDKILISPGPGKPENSKASITAVEKFYDKIPILGVCLGHQVIALVFGSKVIEAPEPVHGKTVLVEHDNKSIFKRVKNPFTATRYHSLIVDKNSLTDTLEISAQTGDGIIMGLRHKTYPVEGVQFHPESILTKEGGKILGNWVRG